MARFNINPKMLNTSSSPLFNQTRNEEFYAAKLIEFYQYLALGYAIIITLTVIVFAATYTSVRIQKRKDIQAIRQPWSPRQLDNKLARRTI